MFFLRRCSNVKFLFFLVFCCITFVSQLPAFAVTVFLVDGDGNPIVGGFKWLVEEDTSYPVTPGEKVSHSISVNIHRSHAPVVGSGSSDGPTAEISIGSPGKRYIVSVQPFKGYTMGGGVYEGGQDKLTITVNKYPIPTAQISVLAFEDNQPTDGAPAIPPERGLPGFQVYIYDRAGQQMTDAFGNSLGTEYKRNRDGTYVLDGEGKPVITKVGNGVFTDRYGHAVVKNLPPGKYGVRVVPRDGNTWIQTSTIEGTPTIDAWVGAGEPPYYVEPPGQSFGVHVFFGFVRPKAFMHFKETSAEFLSLIQGKGIIKGKVVQTHSNLGIPEQRSASGEVPVPEAWVGLNNLSGNDELVYAQPVRDDGTFSIIGVPPGLYQLVVWDKPLDLLISFRTVQVGAGEVVDLGKVAVARWFGTLEGYVFNDENQNGYRDPGERGIAQEGVNIRFIDGSIYQATVTDPTGYYEFPEVFPFFKWLVVEGPYGRLKPTGATITVDAGGPLAPGQKLVPQQQYEINPVTEDNLTRTELGMALTEGMLLYPDQTNVIDWGRTQWGENENGGISGVIVYAVTRAENDPRFAAAEEWEPGIPRVQVNLYSDTDGDKEIDDLNGDSVPTLADVDNYPLGNFPGPEDIDRNGNGQFDPGDAINIVYSDSWDDNMPTGCVAPDQFVHGQKIRDCAETIKTWNQIRPAVFDGGYIFTSYFPGGMAKGGPEVEGLPSGYYIVEAVPPPGYEIVKEEDKNVDFGDQYLPQRASGKVSNLAKLSGLGLKTADDFEGLAPLGVPECVGSPHTVPEFLSDGQTEAPFAGQTRPLCDKKYIVLVPGLNALCDFHFMTNVMKSAQIVGLVTNDIAAEIDPNNPGFGEKLRTSWLPISVQDFNGHEIFRGYTDEYGVFNFRLPSTMTVNVPSPSGVSPNMVKFCLNHPGPIPDPNNPGQYITDPWYDSTYTLYCANFDLWPGKTTYADTPMIPMAAFSGSRRVLDCEIPDGTPEIKMVTSAQGGPYVSQAGETITITSVGTVEVPNPFFDPNDPNSQPTVTRDHGFGPVPGTVTIGGVPLTDVHWANDGLTITGTVAPGTTTGQLVVTRGDNNQESIYGVTVTVGGDAPITVGPGESIQDAINSAPPNSLIMVAPGRYNENIIMWKPVRLQGWGPLVTEINGLNFQYRQKSWEYLLTNLYLDQAFDIIPEQTRNFLLSLGPTILVLSNEHDPSLRFGWRENARIDGFTITFGTEKGGGGIFVNAYAHFLEISNNRVLSNWGEFGGGIRIGSPSIVLAHGKEYANFHNDHINIHNNYIVKNGSVQSGGGIALYNGSENYKIVDNFICGNFALLYGGGIAHFGLSDQGLIRHNVIVLNESFDEGGAIMIAGEAPLPGQELTPGAGSVTVDGNIIQSNMSGDDGGGIMLLFINGLDVALHNSTKDLWHRIEIFNNFIVNNIAADGGAGISLDEVTNAYIMHNTISFNVSTGTGVDAFTQGTAERSAPQPAGILAKAHSINLINALGYAQLFAAPVLKDNIIWNNYSNYWDALLNNGLGGLLPNPCMAIWNLDVIGTWRNSVPRFKYPFSNCEKSWPDKLQPEYNILNNIANYSTTNISQDPGFISQINLDLNGFPSIPETTFQMNVQGVAAGTPDFITITAFPLTTIGDYHITEYSPAVNNGGGWSPESIKDVLNSPELSGLGSFLNAMIPNVGELLFDIDGEARPNELLDIGADEYYPKKGR